MTFVELWSHSKNTFNFILEEGSISSQLTCVCPNCLFLSSHECEKLLPFKSDLALLRQAQKILNVLKERLNTCF